MKEFVFTVLFLSALLWQPNDSATLEEITVNHGAKQSFKDIKAATALKLEQVDLEKVQSDAKPTNIKTLVTKYQQMYKGMEVYGYGVSLEANEGGTWTDFAMGLIAKDIEKDVEGKKILTEPEIKRVALKQAGYDAEKHVTDYDSSKKKMMIYIDTSEHGRNTSKVVYSLNFLLFKDKSLITPRNENPKSTSATSPPIKQVPISRAKRQTADKKPPQDDDPYEKTAREVLANPKMIIDASTGEVLEYVDTLTSAPYTKARGYGGNAVVGKYQYGEWEWAGRRLKMDKPSITSGWCRAENPLAYVASAQSTFPSDGCFVSGSIYSPYREWCTLSTSTDVYPNWANPTTFSQVHDGLFFATRFQEMLMELYGDVTLPSCCGQVRLCVHYGSNFDNAFFINQGHCETYYGDGGSLFYGLASPDVVAHELGHAIVHCTSGLHYSCQSGGINEAFADISGIVFKAFLQGYHTNWMIGDTIMKNIGWREALRFMDDPPNDHASIDCNNDYKCQNVHYTSGIYNKAFYNLVMMDHWNLRTAYAIFLRATKMYWNSLTGFDEGLCGLVRAATDLGYRSDDVREAFAKVGVFCGCPKGWYGRVEYIDHIPHGRRTTCYKIVKDVASWAEARVYCKAMESELVVLESTHEIQWMTKYLTWLTTVPSTYKHTHHLLEKSEYWIGSTDISAEGAWQWVPQDKPVNNAYWRSGEPNDFQQVQNCAALRQFTTSTSTYPIQWNWVDDDCYQKKFFICERSCCGAPCRKNC